MTLIKWNIFCVTENQFSSGWLEDSEGQPTSCFNNTAHVVNTELTAIIETTEKITVKLQREDIPTGGHYNCEGFSFMIKAYSTNFIEVKWPFPVNILSVHSQTSESQLEDVLNATVNPKTLVGVTTDTGVIGTNTLTVNETVINNLKIGFDVYIIDDYLGRIIEVNSQNSTISFENELENEYSSGSSIYGELRIIRNYNFGYNSGNDFGAFNGNKYLPTNTITKVCYTNTSNVQKKFCFSIEYLF